MKLTEEQTVALFSFLESRKEDIELDMENFGMLEPLLEFLYPSIPDPYFRQDFLGSYIYDEETNEVILIFHEQTSRLEASVLIETLSDFIIDISQIQSSTPLKSSTVKETGK